MQELTLCCELSCRFHDCDKMASASSERAEVVPSKPGHSNLLIQNALFESLGPRWTQTWAVENGGNRSSSQCHWRRACESVGRRSGLAAGPKGGQRVAHGHLDHDSDQESEPGRQLACSATVKSRFRQCGKKGQFLGLSGVFPTASSTFSTGGL